MAKDDLLATYLEHYMYNEPYVNMVDILYLRASEECRTGQEIIDECTMLAARNGEQETPDRNVEYRLRRLVSIVMEMKAVGLIE